jgi:hypothetical protein
VLPALARLPDLGRGRPSIRCDIHVASCARTPQFSIALDRNLHQQRPMITQPLPLLVPADFNAGDPFRPRHRQKAIIDVKGVGFVPSIIESRLSLPTLLLLMEAMICAGKAQRSYQCHERRVIELRWVGMIPAHIRIQISHQHTGRTRKYLAVHLRLARPFGLLPSPGDGGPEARLRSASRISVEDALRSVATFCRNWRSNLAMPTTPPP